MLDAQNSTERVVKYIITKIPHERYQVNLIELSVELNMKNKLPTYMNYPFSKYA